MKYTQQNYSKVRKAPIFRLHQRLITSQCYIGVFIQRMSKFLIFLSLALISVAIFADESNAAYVPPLFSTFINPNNYKTYAAATHAPLFSSFILQELEFVCIH